MTKNAYYMSQFVGLAVTGLALQGVLSLVKNTSLYSITPLFMWAIRIFLIYEVAVGIHHYVGGKHKPLPWIGKYAEKAFN